MCGCERHQKLDTTCTCDCRITTHVLAPANPAARHAWPYRASTERFVPNVPGRRVAR